MLPAGSYCRVSAKALAASSRKKAVMIVFMVVSLIGFAGTVNTGCRRCRCAAQDSTVRFARCRQQWSGRRYRRRVVPGKAGRPHVDNIELFQAGQPK